MIKINLLSPFDKENLKWEKLNSTMIKTAFWIFFTEALFAATFLFSLEYLKIEEGFVNARLADIKNQKDTKEIQDMENSLLAYKSKIDNIYTIQSGHLDWTFMFENLTALIPDGVKLNSISVAEDVPQAKTTSSSSESSQGDASASAAVKKTATITRFKIQISGNAKMRDDLLKFEDNLKKSQFFSNLEYDDSNYIKSDNIDFSYVFYVDREKLLK